MSDHANAKKRFEFGGKIEGNELLRDRELFIKFKVESNYGGKEEDSGRNCVSSEKIKIESDFAFKKLEHVSPSTSR